MSEIENVVPEEPKPQLFDIESNVEIIDEASATEGNPAGLIDFGTVKAGDKSVVKKFRLWNNKNGEKVCSTMREAEIFVVDSNKGKTAPVVKEGWLHAKNSADSTFTRLNDTNSLLLKATGLEAGLIEGGINDGNPESEQGKKNHANFETYIQIIDNALSAAHGDKPFYTALRYYFT